MTRKCIVLCAVVFWIALSGHAAIAQDEDTAEQQRREAAERAKQEQAQRIASEREARERQRSIDSLREFLGDCRFSSFGIRGDETCDNSSLMRRKIDAVSGRCDRNCEQRFPRLQQAASEFSAATRELERALSFKSGLKDPAQRMEKSTTALLDFVKSLNSQHPRFDSSEFKDFTQSELGWETLTVAENLSPYLNIVIRNGQADAVDIGFLEALPKFEAQLRRLHWLAKRLK